MLLPVNANQLYVIEVNEVPELLQQHTLVGRTRATQHFDIGSQGAPGLAFDDVPHVFLCHHGGLQSGQVVPIALHRLVEVLAVLDDAREIIHGHLHVGACFDHR